MASFLNFYFAEKNLELMLFFHMRHTLVLSISTFRINMTEHKHKRKSKLQNVHMSLQNVL